MAQSNSTSKREPTPNCTTGTYPLDDNKEDLEDRDESARTENMVVLPDFDGYGICRGIYQVVTTSRTDAGDLKEYTVGKDGGSCPDATFRSPDKGCKHYRRVRLEQLNYPFPYAEDTVTTYMVERILDQLGSFREEYDRLTSERKQITDEDTREEYDTVIETLALLMEKIAEEYDRFYDAVNGRAPERTVTVPNAEP